MTPANVARFLIPLIILSPACASRSRRVTLPEVASAGCPVMLLTRTGGLGYESQGGVIAAVWASGEILRSEFAAQAGANHFVGSLSPTDLAALMEVVQSARIWDQPRGQSVLDSPDDILTLRRGTDVRQWEETPGFTSSPVVSAVRSMLFAVPVTGARTIDTKLDDVMKCATPAK